MRPVRAERVGNRIHLRTPYLDDPWEFQEQLDKLKGIPGANFSGAKKVWTYPLDLSACRQMRRAFGDRLQLGPELTAWGRAAVVKERELLGVLDLDPRAAANLERIPSLAPTLHAAMLTRGYQTIAAKFGAVAGPHCNFDEQGLGKCIESLGALIEAGVEGKGLLIAPRTALSVTWAPEIAKWMDDVPGDVLVQLPALRDMPRRPGRARVATDEERHEAIAEFLAEADQYRYAFLLINPQMLKTTRSFKCTKIPCGGESCENKRNHRTVYQHRFPELHAEQWDFLIGDEVHLYTIHGRQKKPSQVGLGFHRLQAKPIPQSEDGMRIALTGTPNKGRPLKLWATLSWVRPSVYSSRWTFAGRFFKSKPNKYTQSGIEFLDELDPKRVKDLDRELAALVIRRTSKELRDLNEDWAPPPIRYIEAFTDMTEKQAALYDQMVDEAAAELDGRVLTADNVLAQLTRLKQFAGAEYGYQRGELVVTGSGGKFEWVAGHLLARLGIEPNGEGDGDAKLVIASQYTKHLQYWRNDLLHRGIDCHILTGQQDDDQRRVAQQSFQSPGGPRVFLLQTYVGGVSLTLDAADYGVMMDETFVPDDQDQVEKRLHRTSNVTHNVTWYYVRARGTLESDIANENERKRDNDRGMLDGRRGVEWARKNFAVNVKGKKPRSRSTTGS
jgi:hypothetical protein